MRDKYFAWRDFSREVIRYTPPGVCHVIVDCEMGKTSFGAGFSGCVSDIRYLCFDVLKSCARHVFFFAKMVSRGDQVYTPPVSVM